MPKNILVIDDEESICDAFGMALEGDEYLISAASTGEDGLEAVRNKCPDLVFLDLKMPGIGGIETLRRLHECSPDLPVYILTAFRNAYRKELQKAVDDGIKYELCNKPIDSVQIKRVVNSIFKNDKTDDVTYKLKLYIAGNVPNTDSIKESIKEIFYEKLRCKYELTLIDIIKSPQQATDANIVATPTLVLVHPSGDRMVIGDLSDTEKVVRGLGLM
ncbi:MAG: response regulator [Candidatus Anammoxibacter sp.]